MFGYHCALTKSVMHFTCTTCSLTIKMLKIVEKVVVAVVVWFVGHPICIFAKVVYEESSNISQITIGLEIIDGKNRKLFKCNFFGAPAGLTEISKAQNAKSINILASKSLNVTNLDDIVKYIHKSSELKTCIFYDSEQYFNHIEDNQKGFIETTSLIFAKPFHILNEVSFFRCWVQ